MKKFMLSLLLVTPLVCKTITEKGAFITGFFSRCENDEVICYLHTAVDSAGLSCKFKEKENVYIPSNVPVPEREPSRELQKPELLSYGFSRIPQE